MMIHVDVSTFIRADPWRVCEILADYDNWPKLFPSTIRGVKLLRREGATLTLEIDHKEGKVVNALRILSPEETELEEWKKRYHAHYAYRFLPSDGGTRFSLIADVELKRPYKTFGSFLKPFIVHQMKRQIVEPLKSYADSPRIKRRGGGTLRAKHPA
jgi:hypothetical protein